MKVLLRNFINLTDSYKVTHWFQYPPDTQAIYSYMEPRVGAQYQDIIWLGLQGILKSYDFIGPVIVQSDLDSMKVLCKNHFGFESYFNYDGWNIILREHDGYLPLKIYALPEGSIVAPGTPVMAIENTDERLPWLTNYVESLLMHSFAGTNTATISYAVYKVIKEFADICGEEVSPVHLNDFGLRGASSLTSAEMCGIGHLAIFTGTDNIPAMRYVERYYKTPSTGLSVIAAEHSTITAWGQDRECEAYKHIIQKAPSDAIVSLVIDSYNWERALADYFCGELVPLIKGRSGRVVLRPDSGIPWLVTRQILQALWETYGGTITDNGYKVLDPHVRVIYGDGINADSIRKILSLALQAGFSPNNVIFGMGGGLLQQHNRDTLRFAIKCSAIKRNGIWENVCKTTPGKESKAGKFDLPLVYDNGKLIVDDDFVTIRNRIGVITNS